MKHKFYSIGSIILLLLLALFASQTSFAQNTFPSSGAAGIGTTTPNASSILDIVSTTKGILIPRMTRINRDSIHSPATGLMIYQTNSTPGFYYYSGLGWKALAPAGVNKTLSNLTSPTAINVSVLPGAGGLDIGSNAAPWYNAYLLGNLSAGSVSAYNNAGIALSGNGPTGGGVAGLSNSGPGVQGSSTSGYGVYGNSSNADGVNGHSSNGNGVYGTSDNGYGVYGNSPGNIGVYGLSYSGNAIYGYSTTGNGMYGLSINNYGVYGSGRTGIYGTGGDTGVSGNGIKTGVFGKTTNGYGVYGHSANLFGIYGVSVNNYGVYASGRTGVYGSGGDTGIIGNGAAVGIFGKSSNGKGIIGNSTNSYGVYGSGRTGVYAIGIDTGINGNGYWNGVIGSSGVGNGVYGYSSSGFGVKGTSSTNTAVDGSSTSSWGVNGTGTVGVRGYSSTSNGTGVWGIAANGNGIVANAQNSSYYGAYSVGSIFCDGLYQGSDENLRQNIRNFSNALGIINRLQPKQYEFRQDGNYKLMNLPHGNQYGLIAQDVEKILPNLIKETKFDPEMARPKQPGENNEDRGTAKDETINFKALNYIELIPIMIKGMQELSKENDELKNQNENQQKQIDDLKTMMLQLQQNFNSCNPCGQVSASGGQSSMNNELSVMSTASLSQNIPNPFTHSTTINYSLPQQYSSAKIIVVDKTGRVLKEIKVSGIGKGSVTVDASTLASGAFNYSLYVDGKLIGTKQMEHLK